MEIEARLRAAAAATDARLGEILPQETCRPAELHRAMRYSALAEGKRLRPALCLASAESVGGDPQAVIDAACAIELVHCFSLIHDDLPAIDDDELRRGRPTCHMVFGEAIAVLAGDALFALAYEVMSHGPWPAPLAVQALRELSRSAGSDGLVGGEVADVLSEGKPYDAETLDFIHSRKTGSLIAASCVIGGLLAGASAPQIEALRTFGSRVGLAFQIADDILNEVGAPEELGKAAGSDRARQKATYPALYGLEVSREAARRLICEAEDALETLPNPEFVVGLARFSIERGR